MMQAARDIIIRSSGHNSMRRGSSKRRLSTSGYESHGSEKRTTKISYGGKPMQEIAEGKRRKRKGQ